MRTLDDNIVTIPNNKVLTDVTSCGNYGQLHMQVGMDFFVGMDQNIELAEELVDTSGEFFCVPTSSSCTCDGSDTSLRRACTVTWDPPSGIPDDEYSCVGEQVCQAVDGWATCSAPDEVCNLLDDDCDGFIDEGFVDADGRLTYDGNCGSCGNDCSSVTIGTGPGACIR